MKRATGGAGESRRARPVASVIAGKYEIVAPLTAGGAGTTYKVRHVLLDEAFAVTVLADDVAGARVERLQAAVRAAAGLGHDHVVRVLDLGEDDGCYHVVEAFSDADPLAAVLRNGALAATDALHVVRQLADALGHAHERGMVHGALAPSTVLVARAVPPRALVAGFATAALLHDGPVPPELLRYAAPERLRGETPDVRADVFALGMLAYELFEGRPFLAGSDDEVRALLLDGKAPLLPQFSRIVPTGVSALVARAIRRVPGQRQQTMAQLREEVDECLRRIGERPATVPVDAPPRRRPVMVVDAAVVDAADDLPEPDDEPTVAPAPAAAGGARPVRVRIAATARRTPYPPHVVVGRNGRRPGVVTPGRALAAVLVLAVAWPAWRWTHRSRPETTTAVVAVAPETPSPAAVADPVAVDPPAAAVDDTAPPVAAAVATPPAVVPVVEAVEAPAPPPTPVRITRVAVAAEPVRVSPPRIVAREPARDVVSVVAGRPLDFAVRLADGADDVAWVWTVDGRRAGTGTRLHFVAPSTAERASHTVAVEVAGAAKAVRTAWKVEVTPRLTEVEVRDWLGRFGAALQRKDVATLRLYGIVTSDAQATVVRERLARVERVALANPVIRTDGATATVSVERRELDAQGKVLRAVHESFDLTKQPSGFVAVRGR